MSINLVVADPHPVFLLGMERLLTAEADMNVLAYCTSTGEIQEKIGQERPDLLILDLGFRDRNGLDLVRELRRDNVPSQGDCSH